MWQSPCCHCSSSDTSYTLSCTLTTLENFVHVIPKNRRVFLRTYLGSARLRIPAASEDTFVHFRHLLYLQEKVNFSKCKERAEMTNYSKWTFQSRFCHWMYHRCCRVIDGLYYSNALVGHFVRKQDEWCGAPIQCISVGPLLTLLACIIRGIITLPMLAHLSLRLP